MNPTAKYLIVILVLLSVLAGCKRDPMPRNAIKKEMFITILVDIHLAEAISNDKYRFKMDSLSSEGLYISVLKKHKVTEEQMKTTTLYYTRHPRDFDKLYSEVLSRISQMIEENESIEELNVK
jgi:hypothetical protein